MSNKYHLEKVTEPSYFLLRDFPSNGTAGLAKAGGACSAGDNTGFISLLHHQQSLPLNQSVTTLAHQLATSLGANQDDSEKVSGCEVLG